MRLTVPELCALELGLSVLRARRPPDEHAVLDRARERLRAVITQLPPDDVTEGLYGVAAGEQLNTAHLAAVREALRLRRKLRLVYRKSGSATPGERVVHPYALVGASGKLYLVAWCERSAGIRSFRLDRVEGAEVLAEGFTRPEEFSLEEVTREGRVLQHGDAPMMRIRYSARVARWIAEREGRVVEGDGSLVLDHPLVDEEWGLRHVLQYGPEAEVLAPGAFRERVRGRVKEMLAPRDAGA
jgi:proteasome accessory factor C